jgi:FAD/FMN-containing dehydrogenase
MRGVESWGRYPRVRQQTVRPAFRDASLPLQDGLTLLPHGMGRSYGDSCLNDGGRLLLTRGLDRFIALDQDSGRLRCEAGVSLAEIIDLALPRGWFVPVTPGTKFVTVGGAIANDVHGKNHHRAGSFGCHVLAFELLRSDGSRRVCTPTENPEWFAATIGGLGLTGLVTWAEIQLIPVRSPYIQAQTTRFHHVREFFALSREAGISHDYSVSWIDCVAGGSRLGRGLFSAGNHADGQLSHERVRKPRLTMPITPPLSMVNRLSLRPFNLAWFHLHREGSSRQHYEPFFYPLDGIGNWNRLYGPRGFFQYQCVVASPDAVEALLSAIADSSSGSFLAVLKEFGDRPSPGLLSFPRAGYTLALDFPNRGEDTLRLFARLDAIVTAAGGAIYAAKDARMPARMFQSGFPRWQEVEKLRDPEFSSSFWRRVVAGGARNEST